MKKAFLVITAALMLSGCGAQVPNMTEEQSAQIAEYAAGLLMKYDEHHESRLLNDAELEKELARLEALYLRKAELVAMDEALEEEKQKEKEEKEQALADIPVITPEEKVDIGQYVDDFYGIEGISIRYKDYKVMDAYPESEDYFSVQAEMGKKLLVISFVAKNDSGTEQTLDMISLMPNMKVGINDEGVQSALSTLLADDIANYRGTLAEGEEVTLVLLAKIDEEKAANIQSIVLKMQNGSNSATILMD